MKARGAFSSPSATVSRYTSLPSLIHAAMEAAFADYLVMAQRGGGAFPSDGERRLGAVDLALRGLRGERPGAGKVPA